MLLLLDNYDSFTHILAQYFREAGSEVRVVRNDEITPGEIRRLAPSQLVISPGPGTPEESGVSLDAVRSLAGELPILGVCLGHQGIGQAFGATVGPALRPMHGKVSAIHHAGTGVFEGLPSPFEATRYHSLSLRRDRLPECLEVTAWTADSGGEHGEIMGIRHRSLPIEGVQFHPESVLTPWGRRLLVNFLRER